MITYNELVDLVEKINPDQIVEEIKGVLQTALLQIKEYVDNAITTSETKLEGEIDEAVASIKKYYQHNVRITKLVSGTSNAELVFNIILNTNTVLTNLTEITDLIKTKNFKDYRYPLLANGVYYDITRSINYKIIGIYSDSVGILTLVLNNDAGYNTTTIRLLSTDSVNDNVVEL